MAYTTIDKHTLHFNNKNFSGNGSAGNAQTGIGFQPDIVWLKIEAQRTAILFTILLEELLKD